MSGEDSTIHSTTTTLPHTPTTGFLCTAPMTMITKFLTTLLTELDNDDVCVLREIMFEKRWDEIE